MVKDLEIGRKIFHIIAYSLVFIICWAVYEFFGLKITQGFLFVILLLLLLGDYLTTELNLKLPFYSHFQRSFEISRGFHSSTYGILGAILALQFFRVEIAAAAIVMMVFSDQIAALVGKLVKSRVLFKKKTLSGTTAGFVCNLVIAFVILNSFYLVIGMALAASLVELFVEKIDDNLMIPLFAGFVGHIMQVWIL